MIFNFCHFDPYNVFLAIATNIPVLLKTGFVVQPGSRVTSCKNGLSIKTISSLLKSYDLVWEMDLNWSHYFLKVLGFFIEL